jgi:hypothetical protein
MLKSWGEKYLVFYHRKYLFVLCARCLQQKMLLRMKVYKVVTVLYKNLYSISVIKKPYLIRLYVFIMKNNVSSIWFYCSQNFELFCFPIFRFWAYPMKVILSVPNEGYSRDAPCPLNLISTLLLLSTYYVWFTLFFKNHLKREGPHVGFFVCVCVCVVFLFVCFCFFLDICA